MINQGLMTSKTPEWYTPRSLVEKIRDFIGEIDLDPCADRGWNVPAKMHYCFEYGQDGLKLPWRGAVYMNPPYGREIGKWVKKALTEPVAEIVMLLPARTDARWFQPLFDQCILCFVAGRLKFSGSVNSAPFPSVLAYKGRRWADFYNAFVHLGKITAKCN